MLKKDYGKMREENVSSFKNKTTYTAKNGQRISKRKRGKSRYFVFIQERFGDIYCLVYYSMNFPYLYDNFKKENLVFVHLDFNEIKKYLINLSKEKNKSITFSLHSEKFK